MRMLIGKPTCCSPGSTTISTAFGTANFGGSSGANRKIGPLEAAMGIGPVGALMSISVEAAAVEHSKGAVLKGHERCMCRLV